MTKYYYIRNASSGEAISVDTNSHNYAVLKPLGTGSSADLQTWYVNSKGQIKSKGKSSDSQNYCLTMNTTSENTHILALKENDSNITTKKSVFEVIADGEIKNVEYRYSMHKVNDDTSSVGYKTIKVEKRSSSNDWDTDFRWIWVPVSHRYGITFTSKPTTAGGLMGGTVDGAFNVPYLRLYIYKQNSGSSTWSKVGDPIIPRPNGSWAVNLTGASRYAAVLVVQTTTPSNSYSGNLPSVGGDVLAVSQFTASAPVVNYAAQYAGNDQLLQMENWPFEFTADFTIEAWVKMNGKGAIFGTSPGPLSAHQWEGVLLGVQDDVGSVLFGLCYQGASPYTTATFSSAPTLITDGSWHHIAAMRMGDSLMVYLDGTLLKGTQSVYNATTRAPLDPSMTSDILITNQQYAWFGGVYPMTPNPNPSYLTNVLPYTLPNYKYNGMLDNARVWNKALNPYQVRKGMYSPVNTSDPDLLGEWTFDQRNGGNSVPNKNYGVSISPGVTYTSDKVVQPLLNQMPYLTAQCKLMEDYIDPKHGTTETTYHTVLTVYDADGNRMPDANLYLKADQSCVVYVPQGTSYDDKSLTTNLRQFTTNHVGEFNFAYVAGDNLTAPMFSVQTDFMASDEWLLIFPDRHLHHSIATVNGAQVQQLTNNRADAAAAESLAKAVSNFMASALEHDVQGAYPLLWLVDEPAENVFKPVPRLYQNTASARQAYNPRSDMTTLHYMNTSTQPQRIASGNAMPVKNWQYTNTGGFSANTSVQQTRMAKAAAPKKQVYLNKAAAIHQAMLDTGKTTFTRDEIVALAKTHGRMTKTMQLYSFSDFWDDIKNAASIVVDVFDYVIEGAEQALNVVRVWLDEASHYVIQTVSDAVSAVGGLFAKFAVEAQDIVNFFKATFAWGDILNTQAILKQYLMQVVPVLRLQVTSFKNSAVNGLNTLQNGIDAHFDAAIASLSGQTFGDTQSRVTSGDPADIQGGYIQRATSSYMASDSTSITTPSISNSTQNTMTTAINQLINDVKDNIADFQTLLENTPSFTTLFSDPQAFFKAAAADVLQALKLLIDAAFGVMRAGVIGALDILDSILASFDALMKTRIVIPFVTDLYEKTIHPGSTLTAYDFMALLGAVPMTVAYKLANNNQAPFDPNSQAYKDFMALTPGQYPGYFSSSRTSRTTRAVVSTKQASQADKEKIVRCVSWGLGYLCSASIAVWGITSFFGTKDYGSKLLRSLQIGSVIAEFGVFACSAPIYFAATTDPLSIFNATVWGTFVFPLIFDGADIFTTKDNSLEREAMSLWAKTVKPGLNIVLGVIHGLSFLASASWETANIAQNHDLSATDKGLGITNAWFKGAINIVSIVPELDKFLVFIPQTREAVPAIDAASFATWSAGVLVLTTSDLLLNLETVIR